MAFTKPSCPHALGTDEVVEALRSDPRHGLSGTEAGARLLQCGFNSLPETPGNPLWRVFIRQFRSPLIALLCVAAGISSAVHHASDAAVIAAVLVINAALGTLQERRAETSLAALRKLSTLRIRVVRDGVEQLLEARDLVPGDILILAAGDEIGADARVLESRNLETAEAALSGESAPVAKGSAPVGLRIGLAGRVNMVFAGTHVTAGRGRAVVVFTGTATEIGQIATLTHNAPQPPTPLEARLAGFSRRLFWAAIGLFCGILGVGWMRGIPFGDIFLLAISEMVSMVPEGLPVAWSIALAVGSRRICARGAIVRTLSAVETLGSVDVICTDKTGTLTRNEMTATRILLPSGRRLEVSGAGYSPEGRLFEDGRECDAARDPELALLLEAGVLCNDAQLLTPAEDGGIWSALGDPTEAALLTLALKAGLNPAHIRKAWPREAEIPFDPDRKWMVTEHRGGDGRITVLKGAPEAVLAQCTLSQECRRAVACAAAQFASRRLRVLAFARGECSGLGDSAEGPSADGVPGAFGFLGLVAQTDPPRVESKGAVAACIRAGIRPVMVTGDHAETALAVARELGIERGRGGAIDGEQLDALSEEGLLAELESVSVFARVHPAQKLRIVRAFQSRGHVVAMTGDGVNDAPALATADVGVAMGVTGTEVAKEASKIVLTDDRFATLVQAAAEGRLVHQNLRKVLLFLFATSVDEVLLLVLSLLLGLPLPLNALQILWINIVTEGVITVNLILEEPEGDEMLGSPHSPSEPLFTRPMRTRLLWMSLTSTAVCMAYLIWRLGGEATLVALQSEMFTLVTLCQWFNVLNCRSATASSVNFRVLQNRWLTGGLVAALMLQAAVLYAPALNRFFHTAPLGVGRLGALMLAASTVLWVEEIRKLFARRGAGRGTAG